MVKYRKKGEREGREVCELDRLIKEVWGKQIKERMVLLVFNVEVSGLLNCSVVIVNLKVIFRSIVQEFLEGKESMWGFRRDVRREILEVEMGLRENGRDLYTFKGRMDRQMNLIIFLNVKFFGIFIIL